MKKIDIGQALTNSDVAKALSEFTVDMMSNIEVTNCLREAFAQNIELQNSRKKLIEYITAYNKKSRRVNISDKTTVFDKNTTFIYQNPDPLYKKEDTVFYVDLRSRQVHEATIVNIDTGISPPSYTIKKNDNSVVHVEEYSLRAYDNAALDETKNVWLAEENLRKVNNKLIMPQNKISKQDLELTKAMDALADAMKKEDKATGGDPLSENAMNNRIKILNKWAIEEQIRGGRNRRTKKAHYYSKRRRTRHYRSKRVRSK